MALAVYGRCCGIDNSNNKRVRLVRLLNKRRQLDQISARSSLQFSRCAGRYRQVGGLLRVRRTIVHKFMSCRKIDALLLAIGQRVCIPMLWLALKQNK